MTKKISIGLTVVLLIVSICLTAVLTVFVYLSHYNDFITELPQRAQQYDKLSEVDELVRSEYFGSLDSTKINASLIDGYLSGLDENCYYIPAEDFEYYSKIINGNLSGIGINAYFDEASSTLKVVSVDEASPAANVGITAEASISQVNGKTVSVDNYQKLLSEITDSYDTNVKIKFSSSDEKTSEVLVTSGYVAKSVVYSLNESVGYLRITDFYENTPELFSEAISYFTENSVSAVIIDVRNCVSSNFDSAADIIDRIVPIGSEGTGAIYTAKDSDANTVKQRSSDASSINMSFAVLINSRTSGAGELLACDLKDYSKALLFGETTDGNGTYQEIFNLSDGSAVSLTVAEIYPYISDSFNNTGVAPDVEIPTTDTFKNQIGIADLSADSQYLSAYSYLSGQNK